MIFSLCNAMSKCFFIVENEKKDRLKEILAFQKIEGREETQFHD